MHRLRTASPHLLGALLVAAGTTHLVRPDWFDPLVPAALPGPTGVWVLGSGAVELLVGGAVLLPRTRARGGLAAAVLFVAVFPGNLYLAVEPGGVPRWLALARLPLQVPLVVWALQVAGKLSSTGRRA